MGEEGRGKYHSPHKASGLWEGVVVFFSRDKDGCTPNSVPMVFIVFSRDFCGV